ncbi:MAG: 50S ribosomal protein L30 [Spirochaetales bacterium]|nr:50S ribosomal protein L30 [Spirochaetales bacterium]
MKKARITLKQSLVGKNPTHRKTLHALGLRKIGRSREVTLNPALAGMIKSVDYLLHVEELK